MLDIRNKLHFPRLKFHKESKLMADGVFKKNVKLYKLDWEKFDDYFEKSFNDWKKECHPTKNIWYTKGLSDYYDKIISNLVFSLDYAYLNEIHRCCQQAYIERGRSRGFDTMIRDICLTPSDAYVFTAFRLLGDCIFNEENKYWERDIGFNNIGWRGMLYKFWAPQTGRGLVWDKAKMDDLDVDKEYRKKNGGTYKRWEGTSVETKDYIKAFYTSMEEQEKEIEKSMEGISVEIG